MKRGQRKEAAEGFVGVWAGAHRCMRKHEGGVVRTLGGVIAAAMLRIWNILSSTVCFVGQVQCWIFI